MSPLGQRRAGGRESKCASDKCASVQDRSRKRRLECRSARVTSAGVQTATHRRKVEPLRTDHLRPDLLGDTAHGLVQDQTHRLDRDVAFLPLAGGLAEGPEDTGGDEPAASDGDEEGGS
jgi:hypothetical protein